MALNPAVALVVLLNQVYVYVVPFPPIAVVAVIGAGVDPEQIVCALPVMVFVAILLFTVTMMADVVSALHAPEEVTLLNQVFCVKAVGV